MKALTEVRGIVAPMDRMNVDTDLIIPKQFLKSIKRTGFGVNLFDQLRYLDEGQPGIDTATRPIDPDFILNRTPYNEASILLVRDNFGCGSSREHAVWALDDFGIHVVIGPSFADIFYNNCFKNGILPITLEGHTIDTLFTLCEKTEKVVMKVDLVHQRIELANGDFLDFDIDDFRKHRLLNGLDDIGITLEQRQKITEYESHRAALYPWLYSKKN